jgi:hypothetical protein
VKGENQAHAADAFLHLSLFTLFASSRLRVRNMLFQTSKRARNRKSMVFTQRRNDATNATNATGGAQWDFYKNHGSRGGAETRRGKNLRVSAPPREFFKQFQTSKTATNPFFFPLSSLAFVRNEWGERGKRKNKEERFRR